MDRYQVVGSTQFIFQGMNLSCHYTGLENVGTNMPPRVLPVPTSILVSGEGIVRWIDQAEHHTDRSDAGVVKAALRAHLDSA